MAGDWIKIESTLPDKPEVVAMATALGIDQDAVTGKLLRLWIWADQNSVDGNALSVTNSFLNRITMCEGFAEAMRKVGWLDGRDSALTFPRFDRHNGQTAKSRAVTKRRVGKHRSEECNAPTVTKALPEAEAEKTIATHTPREVGSREIPDWPTVKAYAERLMLPEWRAEQWFNRMEGIGWVEGGQPVRKWQALMKNVKQWWVNDGSPMQPPANKQSHGSNQRPHQPNSRVAGTANEGTAAQYRDIGKL